MESHFITILKVPVSQHANEYLTVGLFASNEREMFFRVSKFKLQVLKKLISKDGYALLASKLKMIESDYRSNIKDAEFGFDPGHTLFNQSHLVYLSKYANNILQFDKPTEICLPLNHEVFDLLFEKYVSSRESEKVKRSIPFRESVRRTLKPKIKDKVTWDAVIDRHSIKDLMFPKITFDFAGLNSGLVLGHSQDFSKEYSQVRDELATLFSVTRVEKGVSKIFLLGKEPDKSLIYNHQLWKEFSKLKEVSYIDGETDLDRIVEFVQTHDVMPLTESDK